jgi:Uma2 family endonuclease
MSKTDLGPRDEPSPASGTLAALGVTDERLHRLSVDQYHRMITPGLLRDGSPIELLEGLLVDKAWQSPPRVFARHMIHSALSRLVPDGWFVTMRSPLTTAESEPEPDVMLVRGHLHDNCDRHPGPAEVPLVIEVADVDLALDRGLKGRVYARAGIPTYWIVNLVDGRVEVHADPTGPSDEPRYLRQTSSGPGEVVPVAIGDRELGHLPVRKLLVSD